MNRLILALSLGALGALLFSFANTSTDTASAAHEVTVIRDARVFDGERVWPKASVVMRDGLIAAFGETIEVPAGAKVIDGVGQTVLPGLIDSHTHVWGEARRDALRFGVTTELDMFTDHSLLPAARRERTALQATDQADLWSAGTLATVAGGHGTEYGLPLPTLSGPAEASTWVAERKVEGSDYIKVVREDLHVYSSERHLPTLDAATAAALFRAAHEQGLRAVVHASARAQAFESLRDGADGLVHVFADEIADAEFVDLARERHAFVVPTLTAIAGFSGGTTALGADPKFVQFLTGEQKQTLSAHLDLGPANPALLSNAIESVKRLHAAHVPVLAGTDAPNPQTAHGASLHEELQRLVEAGLSPLEALAAATSVPAQHFGLSDRGRIAVGLRADVVLVRGDPTTDILATRDMVSIWKNGQVVNRTPGAEARAVGVLEPGLVSDFESTVSATRDLQWRPTSDRLAGGQSSGSMEHLKEGADGTHGALRVTGTIATGSPWPWAGVMLSLTAVPMQPVDASNCTEVKFWLRGDGREYHVMVFSGDRQTPSERRVRAEATWAQISLPLASFAGADLHRLRGLALTAGLPSGDFRFDVDGVELR